MPKYTVSWSIRGETVVTTETDMDAEIVDVFLTQIGQCPVKDHDYEVDDYRLGERLQPSQRLAGVGAAQPKGRR